MKFIALTFSLILISSLSYAENNFGISMHGIPKYNVNSHHLDYVNQSAPKGGSLKTAVIGSYDSLNPYAIKGKAASGLNLVYDRLMARVWDEPFTMYPLIAEKISYPDDRSSVTFHLNRKAKFSDGSPITANDVIFSFETLRDKGRPNMRRIYSMTDIYKEIDDYTVYFKFSDEYNRETIMIFAMMPILSKNYWHDKEFDKSTLDIPITNGPYTIAKIDAGRQITYQRDPNYWAANLLPRKGLNNFDKITYDYYRDDNIAFEAFKAKEIDLRREFNTTFWASAYDFPAITNNEIKKEELEHGRPERVKSLIFNTRREPFNDINVRKALSLVFNFEWINQNLLHGQNKRINSYYPNSELAASGAPSLKEIEILSPWKDNIDPEIFKNSWIAPITENQMQVRHNLRKAKKLLENSNWVVKNGSLINSKTGKPFQFEILLQSPEDEKVAISFKASLKRLGIIPSIRMVDSADFTGRLNEYNFDMVIHYWRSSLSPGTEQYLYWSCESANQPARWNYAGICEKSIDRISKNIADTKDRSDLIAHTKALDRLLTYGHYMIPLGYIGKDFVAYKTNLERPPITPLYGMVIESWWAKKQKH